MAALLALTSMTPAYATEECLGTTTNGDGEDTDSGDCVYLRVYTAVDGRIIVAYSGNQDYDFYQLRWSRPGRAETQSEVRGSGAGRQLVGPEQRLVEHVIHVQGAGLLQQLVRFGLHALAGTDVRQARPLTGWALDLRLRQDPE